MAVVNFSELGYDAVVLRRMVRPGLPDVAAINLEIAKRLAQEVLSTMFADASIDGTLNMVNYLKKKDLPEGAVNGDGSCWVCAS